MQNNNTDIIVRNVRKYFREVKAVDDISLNIEQGQFIALLGPNGAGKTTLVEMIEGIQKPDSGEITIKGSTWRNNPSYLRRILGISFQETRFIDKLTVGEILTLFGSFYKLDKKRLDEILDIVDLSDKRKAFTVNLSGGQRQKLALGISILNKPEILLLDEPTTGLDPTARRELWNILISLKKEYNTTLILTTHYMEEAEFLCDYIVIMDKGKILAEGSLDQLLDIYKSPDIIDFYYDGMLSDSIDANLFKITNYYAENKAKAVFTNYNPASNISILLDFAKERNINIKSLTCRKATLEDLFINMTGRKLSS